MRNIPIKNSIILAFVFVVTVIGVFYARGWYNTTKEYYARKSVISDVAYEIKSEELSNYVLENQRFILYVSSAQDSNLKNFENDFKDLIQDMDLSGSILYLNLDDVKKEDLYNLLRDKFALNNKVKKQINESPASIYMFSDAKITKVLNNADDYTMKRLKVIIDGWDVK